MFAILGFIALLSAGLYFLIGGIAAVRLVIAFSGSLRSPDGAIAVLMTLLGIVILTLTFYYAPFEIVTR